MRGLWLIATLALAPLAPAQRDPARAQVPQVPTAVPPLLSGELRGEHYVIRYTERAAGSALALERELEKAHRDFQASWSHAWPTHVEVRIGNGREEFEAIALPGGRPPSWSTALAYPDQGIVLVEARTLTDASGPSTLRHELAHVALGAIGRDWPRWFQEGFAVHLTGEQRYSFTQYATLFRAVHQDRIFHFDDLATGWPEHPLDVEIAYAQSASFVSWLIDTKGPAALGALLDEESRGASFDQAFSRAFKSSVWAEETAWRRLLPVRYSWWPILTGGTTVWGLAAVLTVVAWARRRRQTALRRAEQLAEEAAQDAALRIAAAEALAGPASELNPEKGLPTIPPGEDPTLH